MSRKVTVTSACEKSAAVLEIGGFWSGLAGNFTPTASIPAAEVQNMPLAQVSDAHAGAVGVEYSLKQVQQPVPAHEPQVSSGHCPPMSPHRASQSVVSSHR